MNRREYLLTCLAEECTEVGQRVSKALRFGLSEVQPGQDLSNAERICEEFRDLYAVVSILIEDGALKVQDCAVRQTQVDAKRAKIEKFMAISRREGTLQEPRP